MPRQYKKKSPYWENLSKKDIILAPPTLPDSTYTPDFAGESFYDTISQASNDRTSSNDSSSTGYRHNHAATGYKYNKYANIRNAFLPYENGGKRGSSDGFTIQDAISLCQKAYANVAIFRNAIDIMSEFSNANIYLEGGSEKARDFLTKWMKYVKLWNVKDQYFREFFRSGNVFFYKIKATLKTEDFLNLVRSYASCEDEANAAESLIQKYPTEPDIKNEMPVRYVLLNPYNIASKRTSGFNVANYEMILSQFELESLKNPKNDHDQKVFDSLDLATQTAVKNGTWKADGLRIQINPTNLIYSFYKKQDYEPFAIPFGFAVLDDINFKIELKKIDQAICRTIENVILLITMGNEPSKGGINKNNMIAMQNLLKNESVGRILVADYTTKAEWLIPDMNKVLGPAKYEIVDKDIKEGLQNILIGSEKFANTEVKAQVFFERLKESRSAFLNDFFQPELDQIFKNMGFKGKCPIAKFEEVSLKDEAEFNRVVTRLMELGVLPPDQGIKVIETGIYPTQEDLAASQEKFVQDRKKGYYNPLVGGTPMIPPPLDPNGAKAVPISAKKPNGRPSGSKGSVYAKDALAKTLEATKDLYSTIEANFKKQYNKKNLNKSQKDLAAKISESIILGAECDAWGKTAEAFAANPNILDKLSILPDIQEIAAEHNLDHYASSLLYHSLSFTPEDSQS